MRMGKMDLRFPRLAAAAALAALTLAGASSAQAAVLYNADATTGSVGGFVGDPDSMQVIALDTGAAPGASINYFTVFGIRYVQVPSTAPVLVIEFYANPNLDPADGVDALAGATLVDAVGYTLP